MRWATGLQLQQYASAIIQQHLLMICKAMWGKHLPISCIASALCVMHLCWDWNRSVALHTAVGSRPARRQASWDLDRPSAMAAVPLLRSATCPTIRNAFSVRLSQAEPQQLAEDKTLNFDD